MNPGGRPRGVAPAHVATVLDALRDSGYDEDTLALLMAVKPQQLSGQTARLAFYLGQSDRLAESALGVLVRLLLFGVAIDRSEAERLLPSRLAELLASAGIVRLDGHRLTATMSVTPYGPLLVLADPLVGSPATPLPRDGSLVMPPHESTTLTLTSLELSAEDRVLDLGCGSGVIALRLAAAGNQAAGTDINPRALYFSRLNAAANRLQVPFQTPADLSVGQPFDHLIFNSPTGPVFTSADGGLAEQSMTATEAVATACRTARQALKPGGEITVFLISTTTGAVDRSYQELSGPTAGDFSISSFEPVPSPEFTVTETDIERRRLHRLSLLVSGSDQAADLFDNLVAAGIREVRPHRLLMRYLG